MASPTSFNAKYLGKMYVDRIKGNRPSKDMLYKAVSVILKQAPSKNKPYVSFTTNPSEIVDGRHKRASLVGHVANQSFLLVDQPLITIVSIGNQDKNFVYVTVNPIDSKMLRFWIHAYSCKSKQESAKCAAYVMEKCALARDEFRKAKAESMDNRTSKPLTMPASRGLSDRSNFPSQPSIKGNRKNICDLSNLSMALEAASSLLSPDIDIDESTTHTDADVTNDDDFQLAVEAMDEMYNLNQTLKHGYGLPEVFRGQLLDAWQRGFCEGGMITKACGGDPENVEVNTSVRRV
eukprot:m.37838 g.37838  ORF g.37838 m.37838 type:complete len:292 (-) comp17766_c0_seq2:576-1451(-)